ncbi:MAG: glyoxalase, partial [Chitinophagaceae bacterium]
MHIEHLAIWVADLDIMKTFYSTYFGATAGSVYLNPVKQFQSVFLSFEHGPRIELMKMPGVPASTNDPYKQFSGLVHFALSVGSVQAVDEIAERLTADGFELLDGPRITGDGY